MEIKILGTGCSKCKVLESQVRLAVHELQAPVTITKVTSIEQIMSYGVMSTPGLVFDEEVVSKGRIPSIQEIKLWISTRIGD